MTERLPLFPLGSVLFPGLVLPLHVFEERYRRLVADLEAQPEDVPRRFGVVAIRDGQEVAPVRDTDEPAGAADGFGPDPVRALHTVGCVAEVASAQARPDGRYELIATGTTRFRLLSVDASGPYLVGEVEELPETEGPGAGALAAGVVQAFRRYQKRLAGARESTLAAEQELPDDPRVLSYLVAAASVLEVADRQRLLAAADTTERLAVELELLRRETAVLSRLPSLPAWELTRAAVNPN
ncbi:LON peptidase substrate-binding domain-containing protein [Streptacidiphilus sp. ASG 303]|uniref:LON peptidase substrate-binding domain-containing protein n=1 Tax=Streptacidiphilus sp. ASG 303 TaxID=2896847 RepID=UPI001E44D189|nr:LON peptidase substrate-binding domain-containing protein [Streptacidiphilus sp. ASG 303]MCD0481595.1 LON peptidase substrate-binding domain-containing protein [Streptacidiphilus sp. ASG 303]